MMKRLVMINLYTRIRSCFHESVILICFALTTSSLIHEISLCFNNHTWLVPYYKTTTIILYENADTIIDETTH